MKVYKQRKHHHLCIGNEQIELWFDLSQNGALFAISDKNSYNLLHHQQSEKTLFRLAIRKSKNDKVIWLDSRDGSHFTYTTKTEAKRVSVNFKISGISGFNIDVNVHVSVQEDSPLSKWRFSIHNMEGVIVYNITCPVVSGLFKAAEPVQGESIITGLQGEGYIFENPFPVIDHLPIKMGTSPITPHVGMGRIHGMFPGSQQMQFMLYNSVRAGLYLACHDTDMNFKSFDVDKMPDWNEHISYFDNRDYAEEDRIINDPVMSVSHYPGESPEKNIKFGYDTVIGLFHGDWYEGADIYKEWGRKQWWCSKKLYERELPDWMRNGFGIFLFANRSSVNPDHAIHSLDEISHSADGLARDFGFPMLIPIFGWEGSGPWTSPAGLFPPREGLEKMLSCAGKLKETHSVLAVSLPCDEWYLKLPFIPPRNTFNSWETFDRDARGLAVEKWNGELFIRSLDRGWEQAQLCPYTGELEDRIIDLYKKLMACGIDVIWEGGFPDGADNSCCYSDCHGHPPGYGKWWPIKHIRILQRIEKELKAINPNFLHVAEGICEPFMPYLHLYDHRAGGFEVFSHLEANLPAGLRLIPLYNYVYGPYIGAFHAPYCECNRPETLYWTRCMGKSVAFGCLPMGSWTLPEPHRLNPLIMSFYKKICSETIHHYWKYIMFGDMLKPTAINVPIIEFSYIKGTSAGGNYFNGHERYTVRDKVVEYSVWRAQDGVIGYILINVSDQLVRFMLELSSYGDSKSDLFLIYEIQNGQKTELHTDVILPISEQVEMQPFSMILYEISKERCPA